MGGFLGIGGSSSKTNRGWQVEGAKDLHNVFNFALPQGEEGAKSGEAKLDDAGQYWEQLLHGNRTAVTQAVAPETNMIRSASDAQKRQQAAFGTARGGGTAATNQTRETDTQAKVDNAILGARPEAAKETAKIGSAELQAALNALGLGVTAGTNLGNLGIDAKKQSDANSAAAGEAAGQLISAALAFV